MTIIETYDNDDDDNNNMVDARSCEMGHQQPQVTTNFPNPTLYKTRNSKPPAQLSLFSATAIQSPTSRSVFKVILILFFHLLPGLLSGPFPSNFPHQNPVCISRLPVRATYPANLNILYFSSE